MTNHDPEQIPSYFIAIVLNLVATALVAATLLCIKLGWEPLAHRPLPIWAESLLPVIVPIALLFVAYFLLTKLLVAKRYGYRGATRLAAGDLVGALSDLNEAIRLRCNYAEAFSNRGIIRDAMGNTLGAFADFNEAIRLKPQFAGYYYNRAKFLMDEKLVARVIIADFQNYLDLSTGDQNGQVEEVRKLIRVLTAKL